MLRRRRGVLGLAAAHRVGAATARPASALVARLVRVELLRDDEAHRHLAGVLVRDVDRLLLLREHDVLGVHLEVFEVVAKLVFGEVHLASRHGEASTVHDLGGLVALGVARVAERVAGVVHELRPVEADRLRPGLAVDHVRRAHSLVLGVDPLLKLDDLPHEVVAHAVDGAVGLCGRDALGSRTETRCSRFANRECPPTPHSRGRRSRRGRGRRPRPRRGCLAATRRSCPPSLRAVRGTAPPGSPRGRAAPCGPSRSCRVPTSECSES